MITTDELKKYELMVIFSGDLTEPDFAKELEEFKKLLQENTAKIFYEESWGRREFAFSVQRQRAGYYVIFDFTADPKVLREMRANMALQSSILRHLLVSLPEDYDPVRYKTEMLRIEKEEVKAPRKKLPISLPAEKEILVSPAALPKATIAGKEEEEKLATVEKKLEEILENPDIDIK